MISRRSVMCGLFAVPAVVSFASLMKIRGIKYDPIVRLQSWKFETDPEELWWAYEGPLSKALIVESDTKVGWLSNRKMFWREVNRDTLCDLPIGSSPNAPIFNASFLVGDKLKIVDGDGALRGGITRTNAERAAFHLEATSARHYSRPVFYDRELHARHTNMLVKRRNELCRWGV